MHRSDPGSPAADGSPSDQPSRHRRIPSHRRTGERRRGLITGGVVLGLSLLLLPASAHADLTERELRAKIDKLTTKAEVVTEKYNGQRLELEKAKKAAREAQRHAQRLSKQLERASDLIAQLAATRYKSGGVGRSISLLAAQDPQEMLSRATMLAHLSRQEAAQIRELQNAVARAEKAKREARQSAAKVQQMTADLQQKKDHIEELVAQAEDKLAELEAEASRDYNRAPIDVGDVGAGVAARATEIALAQQGEPYVWGAAGPDQFDCSGLAVYAYGQVGVSLPHYTGALWDNYPHVSRSQLRPGDLVFTSAHHMGIYVGDGQMVHAPNSGESVKVEDVYSYYGAVRVV